MRGANYITAERDIGYILGIIGGSMMLLLLLYPLRKSSRLMRNWGPIRFWFRMHMAFGTLGPTFILFHANFSLGSLNSTVALACMLLVALSGLVGRFLYTRIHLGLYGHKTNLQELCDIASRSKGKLTWFNDISNEFAKHQQAIEKIALTPSRGILQSVSLWLKFIGTGWWHHWRMRRLASQALKRTAAGAGWDKTTRRHRKKLAFIYISTYFDAAHKALVFGFYERLFSLWHVIHLPFFIMMLLSGVVHVFAVHIY